ncbi:MAG TPA: tetratricopeptide repeat protein [Candidatus Krumholzibacteria bacterium]|nr:tetratricopeptide repeat protein [Candidatus Krumholzibacteria bacterium]
MTATAKRAKKHINEDQLVTATVRASEWAQEHFNQVIIGIVALVAAVAVLVFVANSRENSARENERQMGSALTLMQQGDLNAARTSFEQLAQRGGGEHGITARFFKAECELRLGNYAQAATDYEAYLARKDDYPMFAAAASIGRGLAYEGTRQWAEAAAATAEALAIMDKADPRYYDAAYRAAAFHEEAGNRVEAVRHYEIVAEGATGTLQARARIAVAALK